MRRWLYLSLTVFFGLLIASWITHGRGIVRSIPERGIEIPSELTVPLQVKAAFDGKQVYFRYRWPGPNHAVDYDVLRFEGGKWLRDGISTQPKGDYEIRVSMMIDNGSVPEFGRYGAYVMANNRMWYSGEDAEDEVAAHPYLGEKKGQREVGKYLPTTRRNPNDWASVVPEPELSRLRNAGYFIDLWQWRANRTNPIGKADDGVVGEARFGDEGRGTFFGTNWDSRAEQPKLMFDPQRMGGQRALAWREVADGKLAATELVIREDQAVPFDPKHAWKDGDTIPRRSLRPGEGSAADVSVAGAASWHDGFWDVTLTRAMDTGHAHDDKAMIDKGVYTLAFAIHRSSAGGSRFHYVSLPVSAALDRDAQINAASIPEGTAPHWEQPWTQVTLFFPGRVAWETLASKRHAGSEFIERGVPVKFRHSEKQLAHYGIEAVFGDEIWRQWIRTLFAGLLLIAAFGLAINLLLRRERGHA